MCFMVPSVRCSNISGFDIVTIVQRAMSGNDIVTSMKMDIAALGTYPVFHTPL